MTPNTLHLTKPAVRGMAERLRAFLADGGHDIKQTHAYEGLARALGYRNWNTLQANLDLEELGLNANSFAPLPPHLHHRLITWQDPAKDGKSTSLKFDFPSALPDPEAFSLPVSPVPDGEAHDALLGVVGLAVANLAHVYGTDSSVYSWPGMGHEINTHLRSIVWSHSFDPNHSFNMTIRVYGTGSYEEDRKLACAEFVRVAKDLKTWAEPLLKPYRDSGRDWRDLKQYAPWVARALWDAEVIPRGS